jgi:hypothetical protein
MASLSPADSSCFTASSSGSSSASPGLARDGLAGRRAGAGAGAAHRPRRLINADEKMLGWAPDTHVGQSAPVRLCRCRLLQDGAAQPEQVGAALPVGSSESDLRRESPTYPAHGRTQCRWLDEQLHAVVRIEE